MTESAYCGARGDVTPFHPQFPQIGSCNAFVDPVVSFDQARFDAERAVAGQPSFLLADYYELVFSPGIQNVRTSPVPEPSVCWLVNGGLLLVSLGVRGRPIAACRCRAATAWRLPRYRFSTDRRGDGRVR